LSTALTWKIEFMREGFFQLKPFSMLTSLIILQKFAATYFR